MKFLAMDSGVDVDEEKIKAHPLAILDALEIDRLHIVCHDRGSVPGWAIAAYHPRVLSLTSLTVGHIKAWANMDIDAPEQAWYMLFF